MSQSYYSYSNSFVNGSTANATEVASEFQAVQTGLDGVYDYTVAQLATTNAAISVLDDALDALNAFKGTWSSLTGALAQPASVYHNGAIWVLLADLADVTTSEPGVTTDWSKVSERVLMEASGAITAGDPVTVNSDGTISTAVGFDDAVGSPVVFETGDTNYTAVTFDSTNNKIVVAYSDGGDSNKGKAVVGTVTGTSIEWGDPGTFNEGSTGEVDICFSSDAGKVVVVYTDSGNSGYGTAAVGTVSGDTISFGAEHAYSTASTYPNKVIYDPDTTKIVISCVASSTGKTYIATITDTTISTGSPPVNFDTGTISGISMCYDTVADKVVIAWRATSTTKFVVGTVDGGGSSISFGGTTSLGFITGFISCVFTGTYVFFTFYTVGTDIFYGMLGKVVGTKIFLEELKPIDSPPSYHDLAFDGSQVLLTYTDDKSGSYCKCRLIEVNGDDFRFSDEYVLESALTYYSSVAYDSNAQAFVVAYSDEDNSSQGTGIVVDAAVNTLSKGILGFAESTVTDGTDVEVNVAGDKDNNQTGLTPGQKYYIDEADASLTTSITTVYAGLALSATSLLVKA